MNGDAAKAYLNVGCGDVFDPRWTNIDLRPDSPHVMQWDIRRGLPFQDKSFEAVYHSHVLEHLPRNEALPFIAECARVLSPGGTLRIIVPDLEQICRLYIEKLDESLAGVASAGLDREWMTLELLDQMVRVQSGGGMAEWLSKKPIPNENFVRSRVDGSLVDQHQGKGISATPDNPAVGSSRRAHVRNPFPRRAFRVVGAAFRKGRRLAISSLIGRARLRALDEAIFRQHGEIHQWMYDRVSLHELLSEAGLLGFEVKDAFTSSIRSFEAFNLDVQKGNPRKPDSLFVEARKDQR